MKRGGPQIIPRPDGASAGGPAPWAHLSPEARRITLDRLREVFSGRVGAPSFVESSIDPVLGASAVLAPFYEDDGELFGRDDLHAPGRGREQSLQRPALLLARDDVHGNDGPAAQQEHHQEHGKKPSNAGSGNLARRSKLLVLYVEDISRVTLESVRREE